MTRHWFQLTSLVALRELRQRGRSRAFIISTVILLVAVAAGVVIPAIVARHQKPERVGIVGTSVAALTRTVQEAGRITGTSVTVVHEPDVASAEAALHSGSLSAVLVDDTEVLVRQASLGTQGGSAFPGVLAQLGGLNRLYSKLPPGTAPSSVALPVRPLIPGSGPSLGTRLTGLFTVILLWVLISIYGSQIAMGVGEEKSSRIVEVLLATVRPVQLLTGKVTGIGLLVLAQAAGMLAVFLVLGYAAGSSLVHGAAPGIVITGVVFFVLGYAFYCTAYAAAGSMVSRQSEVGNVILPVQIPLIVAYALSYTVIYSTTGASLFYRVLGFLPPTAPVAMPVLYAAGDVAVWQVAVSAALCAAGAVWVTRIAGQVYARSILRTGARVRLGQVLGRSATA